jgi:glycosyltransferase involved in cell wall biosynthesis
MAEGLIIIPAFNEEENIVNTLRSIKAEDVDLDILVVDDGSKDKTRELVLGEGEMVISHPYNLGYGATLQTGFKYAKKQRYKYVIQFDGDGQHDAKDIKKMMNEIFKENVDIVTGSRFLVKPYPNVGFLKQTVMSLLRLLIKFFTGAKITDPTCGFKALSKRTYEYYSIMGNYPPDYPDADIIIQMLKLGFKIKEVPVNIKERIYGESMHSGLKPIIYLLKMLLSINIVLLRGKLKRRSK